jgi:hypothetical protein
LKKLRIKEEKVLFLAHSNSQFQRKTKIKVRTMMHPTKKTLKENMGGYTGFT